MTSEFQTCPYQEKCGGCSFRQLSFADYQKNKAAQVAKILAPLGNLKWGAPVFIPDGQRRRASLAFCYKKGIITFGFNRRQSDELVDIAECKLLTPRLNENLGHLREMLTEICRVPILIPQKKGKKPIQKYISQGDVWVCDADNGVDVVLEFDENLELEQRMLIFEKTQALPDIIRVSHRRKNNSLSEPIVEKSKPYIRIGKNDVFIPAGTFLQATKASEQAMISLVLSYLKGTTGKIADLFCGVGTFSYPLSEYKENQILSIDSSSDLLAGFKQSINKNMISNITILERNLFKYPLDGDELSGFEALVFDPPRAGAEAQVRSIVNSPSKPTKIVAVSCNPHSFVKDAQILCAGGYSLEEVTLIDQFTYSNHSELVALFTLKK